VDVLVEDTVGVDQHDGTDGARSQAPGLYHPGLAGQSEILQLLGKGGADLERA
jgi:hypothetical protein